MYTAEKIKEEERRRKKNLPKQTETCNSKSIISGDDTYTQKKVLQNEKQIW
jgi:hypothetical protein